MEILFMLLLVIVFGASNILCFIVGAKVGQTVSKGETIETPNLNPMEAIRRHQERREADWEQNRIDVIMQNVDRYDGSGAGQKDVPGR